MAKIERTIDRVFYSSFKVTELRDLLWNLEVAAANQRKCSDSTFSDMIVNLDNKLIQREFLTKNDFKILIKGIVTTFAQ